jgi:hypothetical protein
MRTKSAVLSAAIAGVGVLSLASGVKAQGIAVNAPNYVGPNLGAWELDQNWRDALDNPVVPGSTSLVSINNGNTVVINASTSIIALTLGATNNNSGLQLAAGTTLNIAGATGEFTVPPGFSFFKTAGKITLSGSTDPAAPTKLDFTGADAVIPVTFADNGTIDMTGVNAQVVGTIRNVNATFRGAGQLGLGLYTITNQSLITADRAGSSMTLWVTNATGSQYGLFNTGTISATSGGNVVLSGAGIGWFDGTGGQFLASGAGSVFSLRNNARVKGGTYSASDGGIFRVDAGQSTILDAPTLTASAQFLVDSGATLTFANNAMVNNGVITVGTGSTTVDTILAPSGTGGQDFSIGGSGQVVLASDFAVLRTGPIGGKLINGADHTIRGFGSFFNVPFDNYGTVVADSSGNKLLLRVQDYTNYNVMEASGGGILHLTNAHQLTQQAGAVLRAANGSAVEIANGVTVSGGSITTAGTGQIRIGYGGANPNATFSNLSLAANVLVNPSAQLFLDGAISNSGTITLSPGADSSNSTFLPLRDGVTITGSGTIVLQDSATTTSTIQTAFLASLATQGEGHTIRGAGAINVVGTFNNAGTIRADVIGRTLNLNHGFGTFNNSGLLEASGGAVLALAGTYAQSGNGNIHATGSGSEVRLADALSIAGGTISTDGGAIVRAPAVDSTLTFGNLTHAAETRIEGASLRLSADLNNIGILRVQNVGATAGRIILPSGDHTLSGGGTVLLEGSASLGANIVNSFDGGFTNDGNLINAAGHTIRGSGFIGTRLVNNGLIHADVAGAGITHGPLNLPNNFTQNGTFRASNGSTLAANALPSNFSGGTISGGTYEVFANSTLRMQGLNITTNNATILLDGVNSNFYSDNGTISALAGLSSNPGTLTIRNGRNLATGTLSNSGLLIVGADSTLSVGGTLTNSGTLGGTGTVSATTLISSGELSPGASPGPMNIVGDFIVADGSVYNWELSATASDLINVQGALSFGSTATLNVLQYGPDQPTAGEYALFSFQGSAPTLPTWTINLPSGWTSGGVHTSGNQVLLSLTAVPEPTSLSLLGLGALVSLPRRRRR